MFMYLSHPLDPKDLAWPGEPVVEVNRCTDICEKRHLVVLLPNCLIIAALIWMLHDTLLKMA